jgi:hypothetical protein
MLYSVDAEFASEPAVPAVFARVRSLLEWSLVAPPKNRARKMRALLKKVDKVVAEAVELQGTAREAVTGYFESEQDDRPTAADSTQRDRISKGKRKR